MKHKISYLAPALFLIMFSSCSKGDHQSHGGSHGTMGTTQPANIKIVLVDNIQAAFELYDKAKHDAMEKDMKVKSTADSTSDHFIVISLMNKTTNSVIKNGSIDVEVMSPDKSMAKKKAHVMEGQGMFHYAAGFQMKAPGKYLINAVITLDGKKFTAMADFSI